MIVWTSVLWKINIQLEEKWPEMVVKWEFIIVIHFTKHINSAFFSPQYWSLFFISKVNVPWILSITNEIQKSSFFVFSVRQEGIPSGMDLSNVNANNVSKQQSEKMNENIKGLNFNFLSCYLFSWKIKYGKIQKTRPEIPGCSTVYKLGQYYLS